MMLCSTKNLRSAVFFLLSAVAASGLSLSAAAGEKSDTAAEDELTVFAAASMTESLTKLADQYTAKNPGTFISCNFDSSGTLKTQIEQGAHCDVFISAAPKQMNELEEGDYLLEGSRLDLLENKVALAVPEGNPKGIESFDLLAQALKECIGLSDTSSGIEILLAMGNSDVPVGQYTQKIFDFYDLPEQELADAGCITYGSNVKEVTTQVSEASVDCGIIYQTDAFSAGLTIVDTATADMCGQVIYPAAALRDASDPDLALDFLSYLQSSDARKIFEKTGFTPITAEDETEKD